MKIGAAFPSKYLKAADLSGRSVKVTIDTVRMEDIGDEEKPAMYFEGKQKGMILNRTNADVISSAYGDDTDGWHGQPLELYPDKTHFQGKLVDCLRVRVPVLAAEDGESPF